VKLDKSTRLLREDTVQEIIDNARKKLAQTMNRRIDVGGIGAGNCASVQLDASDHVDHLSLQTFVSDIFSMDKCQFALYAVFLDLHSKLRVIMS